MRVFIDLYLVLKAAFYLRSTWNHSAVLYCVVFISVSFFCCCYYCGRLAESVYVIRVKLYFLHHYINVSRALALKSELLQVVAPLPTVQ